jgi:hypothetical protein
MFGAAVLLMLQNASSYAPHSAAHTEELWHTALLMVLIVVVE